VSLSADDLRRRLNATVPPALAALLTDAAARAVAPGAPLHLVGGAVRDLLLGRVPLDLDLVLAGDAAALTAALAAAYGLKRTTYPAFGTFTLALTGPLVPPPPASPYLNVVTARRETYPAPAALPQVTFGTLADDLARRDFTINALALPLDPPGGPLLDPHGGQADLRAGSIRVLHDHSFTDDPTRIFRAARYAARFGFAIEPHTLALLRAEVANGGIARLSGARIRNELFRILDEADPAPVLAQLEEWGVLAAIHPALRWDAEAAADVRRVAAALAGDPAPAGVLPRHRALLAAWLAAQDPARVAAAATRLHLDGPTSALVNGLAAAWANLGEVLRQPIHPPSRLAGSLRPYAPAVLWLLRAVHPDPTAQRQLDAYRTTLAAVQPLLTGADLAALGVPRGPRYREILAALRDARLDGQLTTRADEEAFVRQVMSSEP
jgi:tRNA nucleotidyltransferase (CCA-adding enzyme)